MTGPSRVTIGGPLALVAALLLVAASVGITYLAMRPSSSVGRSGADAGASAQASAGGRPRSGAVDASDGSGPASHAGESPAQPATPVVVPISKDAAERAGILVATVGTATGTVTLRVPGVIEPNAYRSVAVTPLVSGRVTRVVGELGQHVRRGETLAEVYSPELAEAHTRHASAVARLRAHDRELQRTQQLARIGAASQQELDGVHAEHAAQTAEVQSARSRLVLLGVPAAALEGSSEARPLETTSQVPAPIDGVITERAANVGLNVDPAMMLFKVVDLAQVWVVASVYEKNFGVLRIGAPAMIRVAAYPGLSLQGRIGYIDPQVNPETRTARVRVEVPSTPGAQLRLGMYVDVELASEADVTVPAVPREAVQTIGQSAVVYQVDPTREGVFIERPVTVGSARGAMIEVLEGLSPGDVIATSGSFFIRAERERLGLGAPLLNNAPTSAVAPAAEPTAVGSVQDIAVRVTERGFEPSTIRVRRGQAVRLTFTRTTDATCATEVALPTLKIRRALPLETPVRVEFTAPREAIGFACGMDMLRGTVLVE